VPRANLVARRGWAFATSSTAGMQSGSSSRPSRSAMDGGLSSGRPRYASERWCLVGPDRDQSRGCSFPIAQRTRDRGRRSTAWKAAWLFDHSERCGAEGQHGQLLASQAAWEPPTPAGYARWVGFAAEFDVSESSAKRGCMRSRRSQQTWCWRTWAHVLGCRGRTEPRLPLKRVERPAVDRVRRNARLHCAGEDEPPSCR